MKIIFVFACLLLLGCKQVSKGPTLLELVGDDSFERTITIDGIDENAVLKYSDIYSDVCFVSKIRDNLTQAIESSDIKISKKEIDLINSIEESDNPIVQIATLKKF